MSNALTRSTKAYSGPPYVLDIFLEIVLLEDHSVQDVRSGDLMGFCWQYLFSAFSANIYDTSTPFQFICNCYTEVFNAMNPQGCKKPRFH